MPSAGRGMKRRDFIYVVTSAAAWKLPAQSQQPQVIGFCTADGSLAARRSTSAAVIEARTLSGAKGGTMLGVTATTD